MLKSLKNILLSISGALLLSSCTPAMFRELKKADEAFTREQVQVFRPGLKESLVYKTNVKYKGREFSSLTYFNQVNDSVYKIVLLTSFGNTLLEAEISDEKFTVSNVISYLDRKPVLKLLENDWRLILAGNLSSEVPFLYSTKPDEPVFVYVKKRIHNLYYYNPERKMVTKIESVKGKTMKTVISVLSFRDLQPENFSIEHPSLQIKLNLSLLKKVSNEPVE